MSKIAEELDTFDTILSSLVELLPEKVILTQEKSGNAKLEQEFIRVIKQ